MTRPTLLRAAEALARDLQAARNTSGAWSQRTSRVIARAVLLMPDIILALRQHETDEVQDAGETLYKLGDHDCDCGAHKVPDPNDPSGRRYIAKHSTGCRRSAFGPYPLDEQSARDADEE